MVVRGRDNSTIESPRPGVALTSNRGIGEALYYWGKQSEAAVSSEGAETCCQLLPSTYLDASESVSPKMLSK